MRGRVVGVLVAVAGIGVLTPLAAEAKSGGKVSFKALYFRVWVPNSSGLAVPHKAKLNSTYKLCSMNALNELEFDWSNKNALTTGTPYTLTITGPTGSSIKVKLAARYKTGKGLLGWSNGALPPLGTDPSDPGKYTVEIKQKSKLLTRGSITLDSTNTCS